MLITALYEATDPALCAVAPEPPVEEQPEERSAPGRVGVVLVSHSRELAAATAALAKSLYGAGDPAPVAPAGGLADGGTGTSAELIRRAIGDADEGAGVVLVCDMGSAVLTARTLAGDGVRIADTPFVEGAVAAVVTASAGGDLAAVLAAAEDARTYRKVTG
ncbi:PTS fructose transporter subunit IIA [Streptomyces sp. AV19]|uniref:PTS-dependent dihydroxyacetone kinase phosphotransferase subunit DhaM n=1 Tax=Streptomyces sp. AV19 TaxID=2793068 RepID=UPI001F3680A1|nr:PTS fructose transporter subunit IIA [Streptomyces sp. AV19]MDG4533017.1 PTS fructose transporter subunit IIA [Streptomyces sp. AV19]